MRTFLIAFLLTTVASAQEVGFTFAGQVSSISVHEAAPNITTTASSTALGGYTFAVGQTVIGSFTYDLATIPTDFNGTSDGILVYLQAGTFHFEVPANGYSFSNPPAVPASVAISDSSGNSSGFDTFNIQTSSFDGGGNFITSYVGLVDQTGTVFQDFSLTSGLTLVAFSFRQFSLEFTDAVTGDITIVRANVSSLTPIAVPEPAVNAVALGSFGLLAAALFRWKAFQP